METILKTVNILTRAQYEDQLQKSLIKDDELYCIPEPHNFGNVVKYYNTILDRDNDSINRVVGDTAVVDKKVYNMNPTRTWDLWYTIA